MKIKKELTKGSHTMLVLSVLAKEDMYGYQIIKTLSIRSENVFEMNEGTLYPILHSLEKDELLEAYTCEVDGRKRKYYKITDKGLKELENQKEEWSIFSASVSKVLSECRSFSV